MKTVSQVLFIAVSLVLAGCAATVDFKNSPAASGAKINVMDSRQASERNHRRGGALEPVSYYGDQDFSVPPLRTLAALLESRLPPGTYELEIEKFRVIDIFPKRMGSAVSGAMAGALGSLGYSTLVVGASSLTQDNITCLAEGKLQSKTFAVSASVPYRLPVLAGMVRSEPAFRDAAYTCLERLAESVVTTE